MTKRIYPALILGSALLLSACVSGNSLSPYVGNPNSVLATNQDGGTDKGNLIDGDAAVVYDPDGCQNWMIDDGLEGYAGRRFDPVSGLPVCDNQYPPGTVVGQYQSSNPGIRDYVPHNGD